MTGRTRLERLERLVSWVLRCCWLRPIEVVGWSRGRGLNGQDAPAAAQLYHGREAKSPRPVAPSTEDTQR